MTKTPKPAVEPQQATRMFLIDGTALCYRAFYAIRSLATSDGRPTNAVYGFVRMLNALRDAQHPEYLAVAFDAGKPTFRHKRFRDYKVQRKPMPDPLISQLPVIRDVLEAYRIPVFQLEGYEAEDLIATLIKRLVRAGRDAIVVTGDKDLLQLVGPHVRVYNPYKDHLLLDADGVQERYGIPPARIVDLLALMGDDIDNIPGVPGIGEKTAAALLKQFGGLETLYRRLDEVSSPSVRAALKTHREQVELARELAQLHETVPIEVRLDDLAVQEPDWAALRRVFRRCEFKRLLAEVEEAAPAAEASSVRVRVVSDAATAAALREHLARQQAPAAVALWPAEDSSADLLALAWNPDEAWVIRLEPGAAWLAPVGEWLADAGRPKLGHDVKAIMRWAAPRGWSFDGLAHDTMIAAYLLAPGRTNPTLQDVAEEWGEIRVPPLPPADLAGSADAAHVLARHVSAILRVIPALEARLRETELEPLYRELELPLVRVLADMETAGIAIDATVLVALQARMSTALQQLTQELYRLAGCEFNLNSPKQLADVLFQRLQLPVIKRTKTGPSTDSEVLQKLAASHPLPQQLIEYRELSKLMSTYVESLPKLVNPATGRLHTSFHQAGTATGRLSSSDPNLQNIPLKTELGRQVRRAFVPGGRGWRLVAADYSQIELRILAHLCGDAELTAAFRQGRDIHRHTASLIHGVAEDAVTPEMRRATKAINFGIIYGMSPYGLAKELSVPHEEAAAFIDAYFSRYPRVRAFLDEQIRHAKEHGYVHTLFGRRRYIPELTSADLTLRQLGERMAINAPIQGTAADIIKRAMVRLAAALRRQGLKSRLLLQVHDELVCEAPPEELEPMSRLLREQMEQACELSVPLDVVVKAGPNWLEMKELTSGTGDGGRGTKK